MTSPVFDYVNLELRALAHTRVWAYDNSPRVKPRQAAYHFPVARSGVLLDTSASPSRYPPARPARRQRFLSSRETIERLAFVLPKEPRAIPTSAEVGALLSAWWNNYPAAREYFERNPQQLDHPHALDFIAPDINAEDSARVASTMRAYSPFV